MPLRQGLATHLRDSRMFQSSLPAQSSNTFWSQQFHLHIVIRVKRGFLGRSKMGVVKRVNCFKKQSQRGCTICTPLFDRVTPPLISGAVFRPSSSKLVNLTKYRVRHS